MQKVFKTKDCLPCGKDADALYKVLAFDGDLWDRVHYKSVKLGDYTHWMKMPEAPKEH